MGSALVLPNGLKTAAESVQLVAPRPLVRLPLLGRSEKALMTIRLQFSFLAVLAVAALACMPPRPRDSTRASKLRPYTGTRCRLVVTATDPDIRRKWDWETWPSEVGGHDRDGRRVCR